MIEFFASTPVLVLGGAVGEIVSMRPHSPRHSEESDIVPQRRQIGGSAFKVASALRRLNVPVVNGIPVGKGDWGATIEAVMNEWDLPVLLRHGLMDNGWQQTWIEPDGQHHITTVTGCEAQWNKAQLATLPLTPETLIYINGDQLGGTAGEALREWLTRLPYDQRRLIDPGASVSQLSEDFFAMLSDSETWLTLNRQHIALLCGEDNALDAAQHFASAHNFTVICRLDSDGVWICDGKNAPQPIAANPAESIAALDSVDAHCAGLLAGLSAGRSLPEAVELANRFAACVSGQDNGDNLPAPFPPA